MQLVGMLDGLNRYRFSGNAELKAAWESARKVVSGPRAAESVVPTPIEAPKVTGGGCGSRRRDGRSVEGGPGAGGECCRLLV